MRRATWHAFSLLELLVTVVLVAIVSAILLPIAARARQRALLAHCLDNLGDLSLAVMAYTADHDETYPPARLGHSAGVMANWTWKRAVLPYVTDTRVYRCPRVRNPWPPCPDAPGALGDPSNGRLEYRSDRWRGSWLPASYAYSGGFFSARANGGKPRRTDEPLDPSRLLLLVSSRLGSAELGPEGLEMHGVSPESGVPDQQFWNKYGPFPAHMGRVPVVLADGHVQALRLLETVWPVDRWQSRDPRWDSRTHAGRLRLLSAAAGAQNEVDEYR